MALLRAAMLIAAVALCAVCLLADTQGTDPHIRINDPICSSPVPVGLSFTFTSDGAGGGTPCFSNASGQDWSFLEINVAPPLPLGPITCGGNAFSTCFKQSLTEGNFATVDFSGVPGIPNGMIFAVDLGSSGWTPNAAFMAFANEPNEPEPTPEPRTMTLFLLGACGLMVRRAARKLRLYPLVLFLH